MRLPVLVGTRHVHESRLSCHHTEQRLKIRKEQSAFWFIRGTRWQLAKALDGCPGCRGCTPPFPQSRKVEIEVGFLLFQIQTQPFVEHLAVAFTQDPIRLSVADGL